jgi:hypothetical protein
MEREGGAMIDVVKVKSGLDTCLRGKCKECPYFRHGGYCVTQLNKDALQCIQELENGEPTPAAREV